VLGYRGDPDLLLALFVVNILVEISRHDLERRIIPNRLVLPSWAIALAVNTALHRSRWLEWLGARASFLAFALLSRGGLGMGDVKLVAFLGAALGVQIFPALIIGTVASSAVAMAILVHRGAEARREAYALGPFLAAGAIAVLLFL
jgi:prepilin signal peptidase PulO-like enzyme (type II secretory pathway)